APLERLVSGARLVERQDPVDHGADLLLPNELEQLLDPVAGPAVGAEDRLLAGPHVTEVGHGFVAARRAPCEQAPAALERADARRPRRLAGVVDDDVDALLAGRLPELAAPVVGARFEDVVGAEIPKAPVLRPVARARVDLGAPELRYLH